MRMQLHFWILIKKNQFKELMSGGYAFSWILKVLHEKLHAAIKEFFFVKFEDKNAPHKIL